MRIDFLKPTPLLVGFLCGLAVPSFVYGSAVLALPLLAAVLILFLLPKRGTYWRAMIEKAGTPIGVLFLITLVLWLPSMFISPHLLRSFETWIRIPVFVGLITLFWALLSRDRAALSLALRVLIVANAISVVFALSSLTFLPEILSLARLSGWSAMPYEGFRPSNLIKAFASVGVLLVPVLMWAGRILGGSWQLLTTANAIGLIAIVWITFNRSAMAGLLMMVVAGGILIMILRRNVKTNMVICVAFIALFVAILLWFILPPWLIDYQRQTIWAHSIDMAMRSPWFGNGINVINLLPGADVAMPRNTLNIIPSHPHNWLVEVFAETGVFGSVALVTLVVVLCLKLAGEYLKSGETAFFAALLVNVGYWSIGLLNVSFWSARWQISYLLLTAICLAGLRPSGQN